MRRHLKFVHPLFLLLIISAIALAGQYRLIGVPYSDTLVLSEKGKPEKVGLLCVNTPEAVRLPKKQNIKTYCLAKFVENRTSSVGKIIQEKFSKNL